MSALHSDLNACYFCGATFEKDANDMYVEEVAELWNVRAQDSVLTHVDCTPLGIDSIASGEFDTEWRLA